MSMCEPANFKMSILRKEVSHVAEERQKGGMDSQKRG